jgi:hypothetical protein
MKSSKFEIKIGIQRSSARENIKNLKIYYYQGIVMKKYPNRSFENETTEKILK